MAAHQYIPFHIQYKNITIFTFYIIHLPVKACFIRESKHLKVCLKTLASLANILAFGDPDETQVALYDYYITIIFSCVYIILTIICFLGMYEVTLVNDSLYDWNIEILKYVIQFGTINYFT